MLLAKSIFCLIFVLIFSKGYAAVDQGAPGYTCDPSLMAPSKTVPTNAHSVRPADIKLTMALGDSLSAGQGANGNMGEQSRGLTWEEGGDLGLDQHITIPNILIKYNTNLFGQSHGIGPQNDWKVAFLNQAVPGQKAVDLRAQAYALVNSLKNHTEIDLQNDWKLLTIFIGTNDICYNAYCLNPSAYSPDNYISYIKQSINIVRAAVPRVIVSLVTMDHAELFEYQANQACNLDHCSSCWNNNYTLADLAQVVLQYQQN